MPRAIAGRRGRLLRRLGPTGGGGTGAPSGGAGFSTTVDINNSTGTAQTAYPVWTGVVTYRAGMKTDFSDVRFKDGGTTLAYGRDVASLIPGVSCEFWISTDLPNAAAASRTMTWDGVSADASNWAAVFPDLYDNFATIDAGKWTATTAGPLGEITTGLDCFSYDQLIAGTMQAGGGAVATPTLLQSIVGDKAKNRIYLLYEDATNPNTVNGYIKVIDYSGADITVSVTGSSGGWAAPPHPAAATLDDNGNIVTGSNGGPEVWVINTTTGAADKYNVTSVTGAVAITVCHHSPGKVILSKGGTPRNLWLLTLNGGGGTNFTVGDNWTFTAPDTIRNQGIAYIDSKFQMIGDSSAMGVTYQWGIIVEYNLPNGGGALGTPRIYRHIGRDSEIVQSPNTLSNASISGGVERQGICWDGTQVLFADASGFIFAGRFIRSAKVLQLAGHSSTTSSANRAYLQAVATFGRGYRLITRAKGDGNYTGFGFKPTYAASAGDIRSSPTDSVFIRDDTTLDNLYNLRSQIGAAAPTSTSVSADAGGWNRSLKLWELARSTNYITSRKNGVQVAQQAASAGPNLALRPTFYDNGATVAARQWGELEVAWMAMAPCMDVEPTVTVN